MLNKFSSVLALTALVGGLHIARGADITGTVTLEGTPPPEKLNELIKNDPVCGPLHTDPVYTTFYVVGPKGQLADTVVMLTGVSGKSTGESAEPAVIDQKGCLYSPTILAVQTHQKILVKNSDPVLHNVHVVPNPDSGNKEDNKAQMQGSPDLTFSFDKPENFLKIKCDVHQWMFAWVTVVDHPYFAVTDKEGHFKIANVPPGKYTVEALHRKAGSAKKEIEVGADNATLDFTLSVPK